MAFDPEKHHRRSIRLREYDYSQVGAYFVTLCTQNRECRFGIVTDGRMVLNKCGNVIVEQWNQTQYKDWGQVSMLDVDEKGEGADISRRRGWFQEDRCWWSDIWGIVTWR